MGHKISGIIRTLLKYAFLIQVNPWQGGSPSGGLLPTPGGAGPGGSGGSGGGNLAMALSLGSLLNNGNNGNPGAAGGSNALASLASQLAMAQALSNSNNAGPFGGSQMNSGYRALSRDRDRGSRQVKSTAFEIPDESSNISSSSHLSSFYLRLKNVFIILFVLISCSCGHPHIKGFLFIYLIFCGRSSEQRLIK